MTDRLTTIDFLNGFFKPNYCKQTVIQPDLSRFMSTLPGSRADKIRNMNAPFLYRPPRIVNIADMNDESSQPENQFATSNSSPAYHRQSWRKRSSQLVCLIVFGLLGNDSVHAGQPLVCLIQPSNIAEVGHRFTAPLQKSTSNAAIRSKKTKSLRNCVMTSNTRP